MAITLPTNEELDAELDSRTSRESLRDSAWCIKLTQADHGAPLRDSHWCINLGKTAEVDR